MKNNYTLHKLPEGFIITSDEAIGEGDKFIIESTLGTDFFTVLTANKADAENTIKSRFKVIAQQDQIDFSALSEEEQKKIGWFDVISLGEDATNLRILKHETPNQVARQYYDGYLNGFQKAQDFLSDRVLTEEQVIEFTMNMISQYVQGNTNIWNRELLKQSLSQQSWKIELEMEDKIALDGHTVIGKEPKLTNGKVRILKISS